MTMSARKRTIHFLRLVEAKPYVSPLKQEDLIRRAGQNTFFPAEHPDLLMFITFELVTEATSSLFSPRGLDTFSTCVSCHGLT